jgi:hypothetical protein
VDAYALLPEKGQNADAGGGASKGGGPFDTIIETRADEKDRWKRVNE